MKKNKAKGSESQHKASPSFTPKTEISPDQEYKAILDSLLKLNNNSTLNLTELAKIKEEFSFFSVIHTNNETGAKNDLQTIVRKLKKRNAFIHTDAVQTFGKEKIDVQKLNIDALTASAHKIGGTKGIGFAYVKNGTPLSQLIFGGSQERNRRGGTENISGIIGLAEAVKIRAKEMEQDWAHVRSLKNIF